MKLRIFVIGVTLAAALFGIWSGQIIGSDFCMLAPMWYLAFGGRNAT